jgi:hypothetical protein
MSIEQEFKNMGNSLKQQYTSAGKTIINDYNLQRKEKDPNTLKLTHYIGKGCYDLYKLIHMKVRAWGVPIALILTYSSIVALTKQFLPNINPIYTCSGATIIYICGFIWATTTIQQYYTIQFKQYGLLKTYKKILYCGKDIDKIGNIIYKFKSNMTLSHLKSNSEIIEMVLKTNVLDIKQNNNKRFFNIITNTTVVNYKEIASSNFNDLSIKIQSAFEHLGVKIYNISENQKGFRQEVFFDSNEKKSNIEKLFPEIEHLIKQSNLKLTSGGKHDFKIIKSKNMGVVSFGDLLVNTNLSLDKNIIVGLTETTKLITLDIRKIYHSIVAGSTGYGKSNLSHVLISSMLKSDIDISMFLFDPKKSELKRYRDINRVYYSGNKEEIINMLEKIVKEMDRRNELIENDKFVNNLETYNQTYPDKMGYIIVYIEEIADLMISGDKSYSSKFVDLITRLGQVGRSTGIRMFLSTQYPKADILPTLIKSNCITRFGFAVSNSTESGVIMDCPILTELKKKGEMYLKNEGFTKLQVPLLEDKDIVSLVTYLEQRHNKLGQYPLSEKLMSIMSNTDITDLQDCHYNEPNVITTQSELIPIQNCEDLLNFYILNCDNEVYSVNKTAEIVTIGRTKLQELRKELINNEDLKVVNGKTYISPKLKRIK